MEGPVCTLAPRTTVPAMHFPWVDVAPFLAIWGGVSGWEAHGLWFYNVTSVGWGEAVHGKHWERKENPELQ